VRFALAAVQACEVPQIKSSYLIDTVSLLPEGCAENYYHIDKYEDAIRNGYKSDPLFSKALAIADTNSIYRLDAANGYLYQNRPSGDGVRLCLSNVTVRLDNGRLERIRNVLIDYVHKTLGYFGRKKTISAMFRHFH
jgi:hypothetical protein